MGNTFRKKSELKGPNSIGANLMVVGKSIQTEPAVWEPRVFSTSKTASEVDVAEF